MTSFAPHQPLPPAGAELRGRDLQRATNDISYAPRLAQSSEDVQWTATNDISYSTVSRVRPKIPRRGAPGVETVGAWVGQKAESPPRARAACVPRQVLPQGAKTRVRVFADIQNFALCVHCVRLCARHSHRMALIDEPSASDTSLSISITTCRLPRAPDPKQWRRPSH